MYKVTAAFLWCVSGVAGTVHAQQRGATQPVALTSAEKTAAVGEALLIRLQWLRDETRVDGCSIRRVTGDSAYLVKLDPRVQPLISVRVCDSTKQSIGAFVEIVSVAVDTVVASGAVRPVVVSLAVLNTPQGAIWQDVRIGAERTIQIWAPSRSNDRMTGIGKQPP